MARIPADLDAGQWHDYAAAWDAQRVRFFVDDDLVRTVEQSIHYPLQLMVDLFEFPAGPRRNPDDYPKMGDVAWVRGYRRRT